jgi:hypothetical protein
MNAGLPLDIGMAVDGQVLLRGQLRDENSVGVVRLSGPTVAPNAPGYDINSDDFALEIVDPRLRPVLQVQVLGPHDLSLTYVNYGGADLMDVCADVALPRWPRAHGEPKRSDRIFEYPGWQYPMKRLKPLDQLNTHATGPEG